MTDPPITLPLFPCYIAMRSLDKGMGQDGWIPPDVHSVATRIPQCGTSASDASIGPPNTSYYTPVSDFSSGAEREYGAAVGSGGPLVAGRAEHGDVSVSKDVNNMTPILYLYCSNGYGLEYVHFHFVIASDKVLNMKLAGVHVSSHEITGATGDSAAANSESFTLRYSSMTMELKQFFTYTNPETNVAEPAPTWRSGGVKGWNKSTDRGI